MLPTGFHRHSMPRGSAGFGLIEALVALTLLAVTLLGACGSLHYAMRATRAAAWQARAVDLIADLDEDLQGADPALPIASHLDPWRARLQRELPSADIANPDPHRLSVAEGGVDWFDLRVAWNGMPGQSRQTLRFSLPHAAAP